MRVTVTIRGVDTVRANLARVDDRVLAVLPEAATAGALPIQNAAKAGSPYETGTLRRSIHTEVIERSRARALAAVGTDVEYARRIELGFSGADSLGRVYNQPPRPYLRPALDEHEGEARRSAAAVLRVALGRR